MQGTTQSVDNSSSPRGAYVSVDNMPLGATPMVAALPGLAEALYEGSMKAYEARGRAHTRQG